MNPQGYTVEIEGAGEYLKTSAATFEAIKKLIKGPKLHGDDMVSVVRKRDNFEIYCGSIQKARFRFGV